MARASRVAGRDEQAGVADHVGEGARVAGDDRDAARHRLDDDAAELLQPAGRRQGRHREHVQAAVEVGQLVLADRADQLDAVADAELGHPRAEGRLLGSGAGDAQRRAVEPGDGLEEHVDALVGLEPADVPDDGDLGPPGLPGAGEKRWVSTPSGIRVAAPGNPLRSQMRPASVLHTLSAAAWRRAHRSSQRNGGG